jgi:hypothetical protein
MVGGMAVVLGFMPWFEGDERRKTCMQPLTGTGNLGRTASGRNLHGGWYLVKPQRSFVQSSQSQEPRLRLSIIRNHIYLLAEVAEI